MGRTNPGDPIKPFPFMKKLKEAARNGVWWGAAAGGTAAVTVPEPTVITISAAIGFVGGTISYLDSAWVAHRNDDPLPMFDKKTTFLFDLVLTILFLLLFVLPAIHLDYILRPNSLLPGLRSLPGWFGFAAIFLSAFLIPLIRGLICNLGLAREARDEDTRSFP
jgi:hypothetical protein